MKIRYVGVDGHGDHVWEVDGMWTWGMDPEEIPHTPRRFTPEEYRDKFEGVTEEES